MTKRQEARWRRREELEKEALARYGVSKIEYDAMVCPVYRHHLPLKRMAASTVAEITGDCEGQQPAHTADEYLVALEGMVEKGWLGPVVDDPDAEAGSYGFTRAGYLLHRRIDRSVRGAGAVLADDAFAHNDEAAREVVYTAGSLRQCHEWLGQIRYGPNKALNSVWGPAAIVSVGAPEKIGRWEGSGSPFVPRRKGWRVVVRYRPLRRRRFQIPEWGVDGWIDRFDPIRIHGKIEGRPFDFDEDLGWPDTNYRDADALFHWGFRVRGEGPHALQEIRTIVDGREQVVGHFGGRLVHGFRREESGRRTTPLTVSRATELCRACLDEYRQARGT